VTRQAALPHSLPPRLVGVEAAAAYVSVSTTKFLQMVQDGRMPKPRRIDKRRAWDVRALDSAVDNLPLDEDAAPDPTWAD
jgi:predicted DNA-binding transcriptional regulator AlpA